MLSTAAFSGLGDNKLQDMHISYRPISIIFLSFIQKISKFLTFFPPRRLSSKQLLFYENMNGCFFLFLHIYISLKSRWNPPNNIFACFMHSHCLFLASNSVIYTIYSIKTPLWIFSPFFFTSVVVYDVNVWIVPIYTNDISVTDVNDCILIKFLASSGVRWFCRINREINQSEMAKYFLEQNNVYYYTEVNTWQSQTAVRWSGDLFYPNIFQCSLDWFKCCLIMEVTQTCNKELKLLTSTTILVLSP